MALVDLGTDCLRDFCDRLDVSTLSAIAGTCPYLRAIARKSFVRREVTKFVHGFEPETAEKDEICTMDSSVFMEVLTAFGDLIEHVRVRFARHPAENYKIFNEVVIRCSGTLRVLCCHYDDAEGWEWDKLMDATPLFAGLSHLRLGHWSNENLLPLDAFREFSSLTRMFLSRTFPSLKYFTMMDDLGRYFRYQAEFDYFMRCHPQLTDIDLTTRAMSYDVLIEMPNLECVIICDNEGYCPMVLVDLQRPKSIKFQSFIDGNSVIRFINNLAAHNKLEELHLAYISTTDIDRMAFWHCLRRLNGLRVLEMGADLTDRQIIDGIESLLGHMPSLERITIYRFVDEAFEIDKFDRPDALCQQRNIAVFLRVLEWHVRPEDLPRLSDEFVYHFGRRD